LPVGAPGGLFVGVEAMIYDPIPIMKLCRECGIVKRGAEFNRSKAGAFGYKSKCRACTKAYYEANREQQLATSKRWRDANHEKHLASRKQYRDAHREELNAYQKRYHQANRERDNAWSRQYYYANRERYSAQRKRSYEANREQQLATSKRWRETNQEWIRTRSKHWREANPEIRRSAQNRRRARIRALPSAFTIADWSRALEYFHGACAYCGNPPSLFDRDTVLHQEHHIPVSSNGPYTPDNIIPACQSCNFSKSDFDPAEWLNRTFGPRKAKQILDRISAYFEWVREQDSHGA
jgi:hypothetical protein